MRNFETNFDFDFGEGLVCNRIRDFRGGDDCHTLSGKEKSRIVDIEQVFTLEREVRIEAHCKRIQAMLKKERK